MTTTGLIENTQDKIVFSNWLGKKKTISIQDLPVTLFPKSKTYFLNDVEVEAHGILSAEKSGKIQIFFSPLWGSFRDGPVVSSSRTAILTPGKGVECAVISRHSDIRSDNIVSSHFSHLQPSQINSKHEGYQVERDLFEYLSQIRFEKNCQPEYEVLAGEEGIPILYQYFYFRENKVKIPLDEIDAVDVAISSKGW